MICMGDATLNIDLARGSSTDAAWNNELPSSSRVCSVLEETSEDCALRRPPPYLKGAIEITQ
jgi:hypothetical protein